MISQDSKDKVRDLVVKMVSSNQVFSAYEVTLKARKELGVNERHYDMKEVVHSEFRNGNMGAYLRTPHDFNGNEAYVYHPADIDPHTRQKIVSAVPNQSKFNVLDAAAVRRIPLDQTPYNPVVSDWRKALVPKPIHSIDGIPTGGLKACGCPAQEYVKDLFWDSEVLYVPSVHVRSIGLKPGDKVDVLEGMTSIKVTPHRSSTQNVRVDLRGNIRINRKRLNNIGVNQAVSFKVYGDCIEISSFND